MEHHDFSEGAEDDFQIWSHGMLFIRHSRFQRYMIQYMYINYARNIGLTSNILFVAWIWVTASKIIFKWNSLIFLRTFSYNFPFQQWPFMPLSDSTNRENQRKEKNGILVLFPSWNETSLQFTRDPSRFNEVFFLLFFCFFLFHIQRRNINSMSIAIMA